VPQEGIAMLDTLLAHLSPNLDLEEVMDVTAFLRFMTAFRSVSQIHSDMINDQTHHVPAPAMLIHFPGTACAHRELKTVSV
jgi:hypothetical protein